MRFFCDTARIDEIEEAVEHYGVEGITTNPRHVAEAGSSVLDTLRDIAKVVDGTSLTVSAEVDPHLTDVDAMVDQGRRLAELSPNFVIKLPAIDGGFRACRRLADEGIRSNVTLVFSSTQALQAMRMGAFYVSPFLGWKEASSDDGAQLIRETAELRRIHGYDTEIIVAAVRNGRQIAEAALTGATIVTAGLAVYREALHHPFTDMGLEKFRGFADATPFGQW